MPASHRQPSLVGRQPELAALDQIVRTIRQGGRLAVLEGEAGLGKTRLVEAVLAAARAAGATVLSAKAHELEAHRPFAAIVDCLSDDVPARWRERVDEHLRVWDLRPDVAQERQFRVAETILELLDDLCTRSPVLLAIEDLHWADPATLGVLARVAHDIDRLPVALVVSARPQPRRPELDALLAVLASRGALELRLGPLDERACAELLEDVVGARPGARLLGQARRAAGNPLFVCELVAALQADGAIVRHEDGAEIAVDEAAPSLPVDDPAPAQLPAAGRGRAARARVGARRELRRGRSGAAGAPARLGAGPAAAVGAAGRRAGRRRATASRSATS